MTEVHPGAGSEEDAMPGPRGSHVVENDVDSGFWTDSLWNTIKYCNIYIYIIIYVNLGLYQAVWWEWRDDRHRRSCGDCGEFLDTWDILGSLMIFVHSWAWSLGLIMVWSLNDWCEKLIYIYIVKLISWRPWLELRTKPQSQWRSGRFNCSLPECCQLVDDVLFESLKLATGVRIVSTPCAIQM